MAKLFAGLGFNAFGYDYGRSLMVLDDTLSAAEQGLANRRSELVSEYEAYEVKGERIGEWDEEGRKIWDQADAYEFDISLIDEGVAALRKAYVIALYHAWERMVGRWAKVGTNANHKILCAAVDKMGVQVPARLDAVRDLNNALKHNSRSYGANLATSWPEVLPEGFTLPADFRENQEIVIDWFSIIILSADQRREVIAILRAAGPEAFPTSTAGHGPAPSALVSS